ncbi:MAG: MerR family transcriptional regulator [Pseudomonadota bacterium]
MTVPSTISDVERDTGVAKETLRVWERRYDFPQPLRDPYGERVYPTEQVVKLRLVKRLIDLGFRPGKVIQFSPEQLQALAEKAADDNKQRGRTQHPEMQIYLELCKTHQMDALRRKLSQALLVMGLKSFVIDLVTPLTTLVGEAWASGRFAVFEEHLFAESLQMVMRSAIFSVPQANSNHNGAPRPRILLTTLPQERHGLGLLMTEALCAAEGAHAISLGIQTPVPDIADAARSLGADIVALSLSASMNPRQALDGLKELRTRLPESVEIWTGGNCTVLRKRPPAFVRVYQLSEIGAAIGDWRTRLRNQVLPAA